MPQALLSPQAWPDGDAAVELVETHISWVFLVGSLAYKVKKPVKLDFLDFSTQALRRHFCEEELRLNRRFAPELYLGLSRIVRAGDGLAVDRPGTVVDHAVRIQRFDRHEELDALLERDAVTADELAGFGRRLAALHEAAPPAGPAQPWATPGHLLAACRENFSGLRGVHDEAMRQRIGQLAQWTERRFDALAGRLARRHAAGRFRECHGDLHCANVVRHHGRLCAFDALEFDPALHWIDVADDLSFLWMDLRARRQGIVAAALLDGWLTTCGDFDALGVLRFYAAYRALVRAKVAHIRMTQAAPRGRAQSGELERYLAAAEQAMTPRRPMLVATAGVSGSGKSWLAERLLGPLDAVRIRSDVERKRLCHLPADAASDGSIYAPDVTRRTYARLRDLAGRALRDGFTVVVDAAHLLRRERQALRTLAHATGAPFRLLWLSAPAATLRQRIGERVAVGSDPSEADAAVLARQLQFAEPPGTGEQGDTIMLDSGTPVDVDAVAAQLGQANGRHLAPGA